MKLFLFMSLILPVTEALAWGPTGHRATGLIADRFLTTNAAKKTYEILKGDSLAKVSNWPDEIRSEPQTYSNTYVWHYTEWKDNTEEHAETQLTGLLLTYIRFHTEVLRNPNTKPEDKVFSLKFLVHLVGDLHQPFHVGNGLDKGGNACKVTFFNEATNLHKVWDEDMINSTKLSYTELADFALQGVSADKVKQIQSSELLEWAKESKLLRATAYPQEVIPTSAGQPSPMLPSGDNKAYCGDKPAAEIQPKLGYDYNYKYMTTLNRRVLEGGIRLAKLLNDVFDDAQADQVPVTALKFLRK